MSDSNAAQASGSLSENGHPATQRGGPRRAPRVLTDTGRPDLPATGLALRNAALSRAWARGAGGRSCDKGHGAAAGL